MGHSAGDFCICRYMLSMRTLGQMLSHKVSILMILHNFNQMISFILVRYNYPHQSHRSNFEAQWFDNG